MLKGIFKMKALTAMVTAIGVLAFSGSAFAQCSGKSHSPMPDQTAGLPLPLPPDPLRRRPWGGGGPRLGPRPRGRRGRARGGGASLLSPPRPWSRRRVEAPAG